MPWEWRELIEKHGTTIATIDGDWVVLCENRGVKYASIDVFRRDAIHQFARDMSEQAEGEIVRYTPWSRRPWKRRDRHVRRVAKRQAAKVAVESQPGLFDTPT